MHFLVVAYDGKDDEAPARREKVRDAHLALGAELFKSGKGLLGGPLLDDAGNMIGSMKVLEFDSREEFDAYLASDPYVTGDVWRDIQVIPFKVSPYYLDKSNSD